MGGGQAKTSSVADSQSTTDGYSVRLSDNLQQNLSAYGAREFQAALGEAYQQGVEDSSKTLKSRALALEYQLMSDLNEQLSIISAEERSTVAARLDNLKANMFHAPPHKKLCVEQTQAVLDCYKTATDPLACAAVVKALTACTIRCTSNANN